MSGDHLLEDSTAFSTARTGGASTIRIALIRGDGIGPELMNSALEVLHAVANRFDLVLALTDEQGGAATYAEHGEPLLPGALERLRSDYDAILKAPVGLPGVRRPDGTEGGLLGGVLRTGLQTYANIRPIRLLHGVRTPVTHPPGSIDYVLVRENTEGLYLSRGIGIVTESAACDQLLVTRDGCERVARAAFRIAQQRSGAPLDGVRRVTCVDKSNVLRTFAFFRAVVESVAPEFPDVELDYRYADAAAHDMVADPGHFDVVLTENFLGDVLSDLGAATVGGLGMCGSGNIGDRAAYFEPIHGTAPAIAGQGLANPTSQILSAAYLLRHLGLEEPARRVESAVENAYADGEIVLLPSGQPKGGTRSVTAAVVTRI